MPTIGTITASTSWDFNNEASFTATDNNSKIIGYNVTTSTTEPTTWIPVTNFVENTTATKYQYDASWARIFHHNSRTGTVLFTDEAEAKSSNTTDKYSVLGSIENYKNSSDIYEFLLEYPEVSRTQYNRWKQTLNPVTTSIPEGDGSEYATGYSAVHVDWTTSYWGGLDKSPNANTFIDGSVGHSNWWYSIGTYKRFQTGIPGPNNTSISAVDLWIRIDDKTTTTKSNLTATVGNLSTNGTYYIWVKDSTGNVNNKSFTTSKVDSSSLAAPGVSGGSTTWSTNSKTFTLTAPSSTSGIARYEYYISSSATAPETSEVATGTSTSTSITISTSGKYIYFRAVNNAGKIGSWTAAQNLYIDTETPTTPTITGGSTSWATSRTIKVSTASTSTSGISYYQYYISTSSSGQSGGSWTNLANGTTSVTITTNGTRYIYFRAINGAGKTSAISGYQTTMIDTTTPTVTINSSLPTSVTRGDSYTILGSYTVNNNLSGGSASCSSNLDGTITNTSSLTTLGTHTIICTAKTGAGKITTATKTVKITYTKYTVKNLVGDSSFENNGNGWTKIQGTIVSTKANSGSKSLYCNDTSSSASSCWNEYPVTINEGDMVYMRASVYSVSGIDSNGDDYAGGMAITIDGKGNTLHFRPTARNVYKVYTSVVTAREYFDTFQIGVSIVNTGTSYYDDILVINLTDIFGAGNEPDKDWCDRHISYFDGSKTIYK